MVLISATALVEYTVAERPRSVVLWGHPYSSVGRRSISSVNGRWGTWCGDFGYGD